MAILAACLPIVALGVQVADIASGLLRDAILSNAGLSARVEAGAVDSALNQALEGVDSIAEDETFQSLIVEQTRLDSTSGTSERLGSFLELVYGRFRTDGMVGLAVISSGGSRLPTQGSLDPQTEAARLQAGDRTLIVGDAFLVRGEPHIPIIRNVSPVGGGIGVQIVTEWVVADLMAGVIDPSNIRSTERSLLLQQNGDGRYTAILRSDSTQIGQILSVDQTPVLGAEQPGVEVVDEFGNEVVQAASRLSSKAGWIVVTEEHQSVAYAELDRVRVAVIAVFVAAGFMMLIVVGLAFRSFSRRLGRMTQLAEAVASGDLTVRTGDDRMDELGRLSDAFDDMTEALAEDIARRERVEAQLAYQATHDPLTGLPNRQQLITQLDEMLSLEHEQLSVLFVDLDGFKEVNDRHGHGAGDELLIRVAERLRDVLRPMDFVARLGGDEFVIVLHGLGLLESERLANRVVSSLELPFIVADVEISISASIGVSSAEQERSGERLIKEADIAMYRAKAMGKGRAVRVTEESIDAIEERVSVLAELRQAVARDELQLELWPIGDLRSGTLLGMEATVRWSHPERGIVPPAEFMPLARSSGFATQIDEWVVARSVRLAGSWHEAGLPMGDLEMAINLTTDTFLDARTIELLESEIGRTNLRPANFRVEVPEAVLSTDATILEDAFGRFRRLGTPVTLDRFGSDHTNADRLPRYAIDAVKIDLHLIADLSNRLSSRALVGSLMALARTSGLRIAAAGVDDNRLRRELLELDCSRGQGLWLSPILSPDEMAEMLRNRNLIDSV